MTLLIISLLACQPDTFVSDYLAGVKQLEEAYAHCTAEGVDMVQNGNDPSHRNELRFVFAFDGDKLKFDRTITQHRNGQSTSRQLSVVGTHNLSFGASKQGEDYTLQAVSRSAQGYEYAKQQADAWADYVRGAFSFGGCRLSDRLIDPSFKFDVKREEEMVRLDFQQEKAGRSFEGSVWLMPNRFWAIDHWEMTTIDHGESHRWRTTTKINYDGDNPVPRLASIDKLSFHSDRTDSSRFVMERLEFGDVASAEFKLSHYGFDDRLGMTGGTRWPLWAITLAISIGLILLSMVFRYYAKPA